MRRDIEFIRQIIRRHLDAERYRVFLFGSRAQDNASKYSDYDIGVEGDRIPAKVYFDIISEFEESDFPCRVDIVEFRDVSDAFKKIAKRQIIEIK